MKYIKQIIQTLKKEYVSLYKKRNPYKTLISCLLSLRTKDEVTYPAAARLFKLADTPHKMLELDVKKIEKAIFPVGFYHRKAKQMKDVSKQLLDEFGGKVPSEIDELLKIKGVGRKTANIVRGYGFGKSAIAVDVHVHRISNRLGWVNTKKPEETEAKLRDGIPEKYWLDINHLFVLHGKNTCRPLSPFCSRCVIKKYCLKIGVKKSR